MRYIFTIGLLIIGIPLTGQVIMDKVLKDTPGLNEVDIDNPQEALTLLDDILKQARDDGDKLTLGKGYVLLGLIYENIGENDLAIERHQYALQLLSESSTDTLYQVQLERMGKLYLKVNQPQKAEEYFMLCYNISSESPLGLKCKEGYADALFLAGKPIEGLNYLNELDTIYQANNLSQSNARIKSKKASVLASQQHIEKAFSNYNQAASNYDARASIEDLDALDKAKEDIILNAPEKEIDLRMQNAMNQNNFENGDEAVIKENIKITEKLVAEGKLDEAQSFLTDALPSSKYNEINVETKQLFKISADIHAIKGEYDKALQDLDIYEKLTKKQAENIEKEQKSLISILKGQRQIDLNVKDFTIVSNQTSYKRDLFFSKNLIIGLLSSLLILALISIFIIGRNIKAKRRANDLLRLKSLRAQMNPHFVFNALNPLNNFIAQNDSKSANKYLSDFSKLMRKVLQDSQKDLISLEEELELASLYLKLEHSRFSDKFEYKIDCDDTVNTLDIAIPPMMIQPFVENAVWHGVRYKSRKGVIKLSVKEAKESIDIYIEDNGVGRSRSKLLKTGNQEQHKSTGMINVHERVELINRLFGKEYQINVSDLDSKAEDTGTKVKISIAR